MNEASDLLLYGATLLTGAGPAQRGWLADLGFAPSYTRSIPNALDLTPEDAIALTRLGAVEAMCFGSTLIGEHFVHADAGEGQAAADALWQRAGNAGST